MGPVLNDIIALDHLVKFDEIMIVHHTGEYMIISESRNEC